MGSRLRVWFGNRPKTTPWRASTQLVGPPSHCPSAASSPTRQGRYPPPSRPPRPLQRPHSPARVNRWSPWTWGAGRRWRCSSTFRTSTVGAAGKGNKIHSRKGSHRAPLGSVGGCRQLGAPPSNVANARAASSPARLERKHELPRGEPPSGNHGLESTGWWPSSAAPWTARSAARRSGPAAPWSEPARSPWGEEGGSQTCGRGTRRRRG